MKIKKGDQVIITVGKDKGKKGKVDKVFPKDGTILLPGLNIYKRHMKKQSDKQPGGIVEMPRPIQVSKVAFMCPKCAKPTRIGILVSKSSKARICRKCKSVV